MNYKAKMKQIDKGIEDLLISPYGMNSLCKFCLNMFFVILTATLIVLSLKLLIGFFTVAPSPSELVVDASYMKFSLTWFTITIAWILAYGLIQYLTDKSHVNKEKKPNDFIISGLTRVFCYIGIVMSVAFLCLFVGFIVIKGILPVLLQMNYMMIILCSLSVTAALIAICAMSNKLFKNKG